MKTRIIYLNEEDKPQHQKALDFATWMKESCTFWRNLEHNEISNHANLWRDYHNNFKPNDQPIDFIQRYDHVRRVWFSKHLYYEAKDFKLIVVTKNSEGTFFDCYLENDCHSLRFKGDLNSGKL